MLVMVTVMMVVVVMILVVVMVMVVVVVVVTGEHDAYDIGGVDKTWEVSDAPFSTRAG